ncbi:MAG: hypothetical protein ACREJO_14970, partial [Phycisphaerales bacterium]
VCVGLGADDPGPAKTFPMDPVLLVAGTEKEGDPKWFVDRGGFRYTFADEASRVKFEASPRQYEIADGGACARMGPLSGACSVQNWAVHGGTIYVFASPQCRAAFIKSPEKYLESEEPKPTVGEKEAARGRELLEKAVVWMGGRERIAALKSVRESATRTVQSGGKDYRQRQTVELVMPGGYCSTEAWDDSAWASACEGERGAVKSSRGVTEYAPSQVAALRRQQGHHPLVIMAAAARGGLACGAAGKDELDGVAVELVDVWMNGAVTRMWIDPASGRVLRMRFRGRGPSATMGIVELTATRYASAGGVTWPTGWTAKFEGKDAPDLARPVDSVEVNADIDTKAWFAKGDK